MLIRLILKSTTYQENNMRKTILMMILLTGILFAGNKTIGNENVTYQQIETTLINGLESENSGLSTSSAYMLGEIKSKNSVDILSQILRNSDNEKMKMMAALSLYKIGTERSKFVLKQRCRFEDNKNVKKFCKHLCISSRNL